MTSAAAEQEGGVESSPRGASRVKLWIAIGIVFAVQVAIAFWLGNPPPRKRVQAPVVPVIHLAAANLQELLAIEDPTLFILPHRDNFSGDAWLKMAPSTFSPTNWTEPARPLELPLENLGAVFVAFMQTNRPPRFEPRIDSALDTAEAVAAPLPAISVPSRLTLEGDLARLRLLTPMHLPPQTNADLLTNTVIRMVVDGQGNPFSSVIWAGSGNGDADLDALNIAKAVRFAPPEPAALGIVPPDKLISGKLVFEWQTLPPAPTNSPPANP